jgi:hypothetical protein
MPNPIIPVWTPDDSRQVADDAELHNLAYQVIAAYGRLPELAEAARNGVGVDTLLNFVLPLEAVTESLVHHWRVLCPVIFEKKWPDPIGDILATWPEPIICPVVVP